MLQRAAEPDPHQRVEELEAELAETRAELEQLRAQLQTTDDRELLQRVFSDRMVLEHLPDIVCLLDRDQKVVYLSRTVLGANVAELIGTRAVDLLVPEQRERYTQAFERAWCSREPQTIEYASLAGRFWLTRLVPIQRDGIVEYLLAASLETTDRVREQEAAREIDRRLRHAIDVVGMGTWTRNFATGTITWDDALCTIFGRTQAEVPTNLEGFLELVHPEDRERLVASAAKARETGADSEVEYRMFRPNGELRHVFAKGSLQIDSRGRAIGALGAVFDVTDRKRLEEQLYQRQKMEAVGELTSGIAHNFNNLLNVILPNLELCVEDAPPDMVERLTDIEHAAQRAADLVRQLMLFARNETAGGKVAVDPVATLRRMATICQTTFDRAIRIELALPPNVPQVLANPGQLEQVLLNICINARDALMDARTPSPRITIAVARNAVGWVSFRVSDNGPGIDEQTRARIFEPFFTTKEIGRGTGLGLATVYAIVVDHGGRIRCESQPGNGASFELELPALAREAPARVSAVPREIPAAGSETILIVDDEELVRRATRAMLGRRGYRVLETRDGEEALALMEARTAKVDLVVLDRSMPGLSGEEVLTELREIAPEVPVLLLSGQCFDDDIAVHADAALIKPFDTDELLTTVRRLLDRRRT